MLDLGKFASVCEFVEQLKDDPIDILVMNAAVAQRYYETSEDGWEVQ